MDIVYLLKENAGEEIIFSLRSLKNIAHGKVFVAGWMPPFLNPKTVVHIPNLQNSTKYKNAGGNLRAALADERVSEDFILFNDDFFVLEQIENPQEELNLYLDGAENFLYGMLCKFRSFSPYMTGLWQTCFHLKKRGIKEPLCYELHIPFCFNKQKLREIMNLPEKKEINIFHTRTAYGNLFLQNSKQAKDVKVLITQNWDGPQEGQKFLSCSDRAWTKVRDYLVKIFPDKSVYEL